MEESLTPVVYGLPGVTEMVEHVKSVVMASDYVYQKSRYERGRARDMAEMRGDWGDFCHRHGITPEKLKESIAWIIRMSFTPHKKFERYRITNCDLFWRHWATVYNTAVDLKKNQPSRSIKASI